MQTIVELFEFQRCVKAIGLSEADLERLKSELANNPSAGVELGSGLYKFRFARQGGGKSGGYRVIYFFKMQDMPLILISAFSKNQKVNLTPGELKEYRKLCDALEAQFRSKR